MSDPYMEPLRFITDDECLALQDRIIEHIDKTVAQERISWAVGLHAFLVRDDYPRHGCQQVTRGRDGAATAPIHSTRRWVAAQLYNTFGFARIRKFSSDALFVYVEPLFRMPTLRVYTGLIYAKDPKERIDLREYQQDAIDQLSQRAVRAASIGPSQP